MGKRRSLETIQQSEWVSIGELARLTDIRYSTLKYYTEEGLLPFVQAEANRTRKYSRIESIEILNQIKTLRQQNLSIDQLKEVYQVEKPKALSAIFLSLLDQNQKYSKRKINPILYVLEYYQKYQKLPEVIKEYKGKPEVDSEVERNMYYLKQSAIQWDLIEMKDEVKIMLWGLQKLAAMEYVFSRFEIQKINQILAELSLKDDFSRKLVELLA